MTEREELIGLQYNRIPTLNRYLYGAYLNAGYAPIYGKFALFNQSILHWEIFASAVVGFTETEIIPRNSRQRRAFKNQSITPDFAVGGRFFLFDSLTVNYAFRDYLVLDKFENTNRPGPVLRRRQGRRPGQAGSQRHVLRGHRRLSSHQVPLQDAPLAATRPPCST